MDFDYKKKRQGKVTEDEIKQALEKFDESKEVAEQSMFNLLESDVRSLSYACPSLIFINLLFTVSCVSTDRTGQSAFCSGPSSSELPQTGRRDPSAAIQQDRGQVCVLG